MASLTHVVSRGEEDASVTGVVHEEQLPSTFFVCLDDVASEDLDSSLEIVCSEPDQVLISRSPPTDHAGASSVVVPFGIGDNTYKKAKKATPSADKRLTPPKRKGFKASSEMSREKVKKRMATMHERDDPNWTEPEENDVVPNESRAAAAAKYSYSLRKSKRSASRKIFLEPSSNSSGGSSDSDAPGNKRKRQLLPDVVVRQLTPLLPSYSPQQPNSEEEEPFKEFFCPKRTREQIHAERNKVMETYRLERIKIRQDLSDKLETEKAIRGFLMVSLEKSLDLADAPKKERARKELFERKWLENKCIFKDLSKPRTPRKNPKKKKSGFIQWYSCHCGFICKVYGDLVDHAAVFHSEDRAPHSCPVCRKGFWHPVVLDRHLIGAHNVSWPAKCEDCQSFVALNTSIVEKHKKSNCNCRKGVV